MAERDLKSLRERRAKALFDFRGGKITEAGPLTFPEGALKEVINYRLTAQGPAEKRLGLDLVDGEDVSAIDANNPTASNYAFTVGQDAGTTNLGSEIDIKEWTAPDGSTYIILFAGDEASYTLTIYNSTDGTMLGASGYERFNVPVEGRNFRIVTVGSLILCGKLVVQYDNGAFTEVTPDPSYVRVRDFSRRDTGLGLDERPSTLTTDHEFNLNNSGWPEKQVYVRESTDATQSPTKKDPIEHFNDEWGEYPSESDLYQFGLTGNFFSARICGTESGGVNVDPPRGHFFENAETTDFGYTSSESALVPMESAFGRVWYAGGIRPTVYFSQIVDKDADSVRRCHQANDPTAPDINDVLENDGGSVPIAGASRIVALRSVQNTILIFAQNGVWQIRSGDAGFSPTQIAVSQVTDNGCLSPRSVVYAEDTVFYWGTAGISGIKVDPVSLSAQAQSLSKNTIQTDYTSIRAAAAAQAYGVYDYKALRIIWAYNDNENFSTNYADAGVGRELAKTKAMIYDMRNQAFYYYTLPDYLDEETLEQVGTIAPAMLPREITSGNALNVLRDTDQVQVGNDDVIIEETVASSISDDLALLGFYQFGGGTERPVYPVVMRFTDEDMVDLASVQEQGYVAELETQDYIDENASSDKIYHYVFVWHERTENGVQFDTQGNLQFVNPSSTDLRVKFEWTDSDSAGRWTDVGEMYRLPEPYVADGPQGEDGFDYSYTVLVSRETVQGSGRAVSLRFRSPEGYHSKIQGWAAEYSVAGRG